MSYVDPQGAAERRAHERPGDQWEPEWAGTDDIRRRTWSVPGPAGSAAYPTAPEQAGRPYQPPARQYDPGPGADPGARHAGYQPYDDAGYPDASHGPGRYDTGGAHHADDPYDTRGPYDRDAYDTRDAFKPARHRSPRHRVDEHPSERYRPGGGAEQRRPEPGRYEPPAGYQHDGYQEGYQRDGFPRDGYQPNGEWPAPYQAERHRTERHRAERHRTERYDAERYPPAPYEPDPYPPSGVTEQRHWPEPVSPPLRPLPPQDVAESGAAAPTDPIGWAPISPEPAPSTEHRYPPVNTGGPPSPADPYADTQTLPRLDASGVTGPDGRGGRHGPTDRERPDPAVRWPDPAGSWPDRPSPADETRAGGADTAGPAAVARPDPGADPAPVADQPAADQPVAAKTSRAGRNLPAAIGVGLALGVLIVVPLFAYPAAFLVVIAAAATVGTWELARAVRRGSGAAAPLPPLLAGGLLMVGLAWWAGPDALSLALLVTVLAAVVWRLGDGPRDFQRDVTAAALIAVYVPFLGGFAALLTAVPADGHLRVLVTLVAVVLSDTGGYAAGVMWGKHPMAPSVSPKKSWEGFAGSVLAAAGGSALLLWLLFDVNPGWGALFGAAISIAAVVGDLAESMIKRDLGIKDMSNLLPGHGGAMDRLDSILFAMPVAYLLLALFVPTG